VSKRGGGGGGKRASICVYSFVLVCDSLAKAIFLYTCTGVQYCHPFWCRWIGGESEGVNFYQDL